MVDYFGLAEPAGWLFCDGRPVSQATYSVLFSTIGLGAAPAAPTFVRETSLAHGSLTTTTVTLPNVEVSGTDRLLVVWYQIFNTSLPTVSSITFNGVNLTKLKDETFYSANGRLHCWYLINPPAVTASVVATSSIGSMEGGIVAQVFNGVNQTTPFWTVVTYPYTSGTISSIAVDVPSAAGDLVLDCVGAFYDATHSMGEGQVEISSCGSADARLGVRSSTKVKTPCPTTSTRIRQRTCNGPSRNPEWIDLGGCRNQASGDGGGVISTRPSGKDTGGRDNMGGLNSGRMSAIVAFGDTQGTTSAILTFTTSAMSWVAVPTMFEPRAIGSKPG